MARRADRHKGQILTEDLPASNTDAVSGRDGLGVDDQWFDQVVVLAVSGSVDALTAPQLAVAISAALGSSPAGIIIDLSKVDFLACAGINTLLAAHADVTPDTRFGVVADGPATSRPLTLLGVDRELGLYRSLDDALKAGRDDVSPM